MAKTKKDDTQDALEPEGADPPVTADPEPLPAAAEDLKPLDTTPPELALSNVERAAESIKTPGDFLEQLHEGAVEGVEIPQADLQAVDWSERLGRCMKESMEASPNGEQIEIVSCDPSPQGDYYTLVLHSPRLRLTRAGTFQTSEFLFLYEHDIRRLGKWLRRNGNILIGRPPQM